MSVTTNSNKRVSHMDLEARKQQVRDHFDSWSDTAITIPSATGQALTEAAVTRIAVLIERAVEEVKWPSSTTND